MSMLTIFGCVYISLFWLVSCGGAPSTENTPQKPSPSAPISWNKSPNSRILLATVCCAGPITEELVRPYIPEAQLWSDGHFLWSMPDDMGARQVFVKQLSTNEMAELLQEITDSGFFDWDEQYESEPVVDAASRCLSITLTGQNKMVCATHGVGPDAFHALHTWLAEDSMTCVARGAGMVLEDLDSLRKVLVGTERRSHSGALSR